MTRGKLDGPAPSLTPSRPHLLPQACDHVIITAPNSQSELRELVTEAGIGTHCNSQSPTHREPRPPPSTHPPILPSFHPSVRQSVSSVLLHSSLIMDCSVATSKTFLFFLSMVFWVSQEGLPVHLQGESYLKLLQIMWSGLFLRGKKQTSNKRVFSFQTLNEKLAPNPETSTGIFVLLLFQSEHLLFPKTDQKKMWFCCLFVSSSELWVVFIEATLIHSAKCPSQVACVLFETLENLGLTSVCLCSIKISQLPRFCVH